MKTKLFTKRITLRKNEVDYLSGLLNEEHRRNQDLIRSAKIPAAMESYVLRQVYINNILSELRAGKP